MKCLVKDDLLKNGLSLRTDMVQPTPSVDEVKIRVLATSVCGTDKSIYQSATSDGIRTEMQRYLAGQNYEPIIVGHEFCGVVEEVGEGVTREHWKNVPPHLLVEKCTCLAGTVIFVKQETSISVST
jgi:threonine dehydrogenase-like Zn-dependent dehydrogenase